MAKLPCNNCNSSDGVEDYGDHTHCFVCGHHAFKDGTTYIQKIKNPASLILDGTYSKLTKRQISEETCKKYKYQVGKDKAGNSVQIANLYNKDFELIGQKIRYPDKTFKTLGDVSDKDNPPLLFGQQLWQGGQKIIITEGEIDCLSVAEANGCKYPVVSLVFGAGNAKKEISRHLKYLTSFQEIYLWFDNDEAGQKAVKDAMSVLPIDKTKIIKVVDFKDANELLCSSPDTGKELVRTAVFKQAEMFVPDGIATINDTLIEEALVPQERGLKWAWNSFDTATYGRRLGTLCFIGAGVSVGKTSFIMEQIAYDITNDIKVGAFMLEQTNVESLSRIGGKLIGKHLHLPQEDNYTKEEKKRALELIRDTNNLFLYKLIGHNSFDGIAEYIRIFAINYGCKVIYLDNLTALNSHTQDERRAIDKYVAELASLAVSLNIWICCVSHLNPPTSGSHEEGGKTEARQFTGSRAIMRWADSMFGLERDSLNEDVTIRNMIKIRTLKDRYTGRGTGGIYHLFYDDDTGRLIENEDAYKAFLENDKKEKIKKEGADEAEAF